MKIGIKMIIIEKRENFDKLRSHYCLNLILNRCLIEAIRWKKKSQWCLFDFWWLTMETKRKPKKSFMNQSCIVKFSIRRENVQFTLFVNMLWLLLNERTIFINIGRRKCHPRCIYPKKKSVLQKIRESELNEE